MIDAILAKIFGTKNEREIKALLPTIAAINELEPGLRELSDIDLAAKTTEFRERLAQGATLDDLLIEAFAVVREAGRRFLNMRHFDVQLIGGMVLHRGKISEMRTGEGKTLVATLPVYLNALEGKGAHVVTVNDYLAHRDAEWMGRIYKSLGMSVGVIVHDLDDEQRKENYNCDITYGTNNEFGFDYLRDNMKFPEAILQEARARGLKDVEISEPAAHELREAGASEELVNFLVPDDKVPTVPLIDYNTLALKRAEEYDPGAVEGWLKITLELAIGSQSEFILKHTGLFARSVQGPAPTNVSAYFNKPAPKNMAAELIDPKWNIEVVDERTGVLVGLRKRKLPVVDVSYSGAGLDGRHVFKIVIANKEASPQRYLFSLRWRVRTRKSPARSKSD
jgi:hypothetical protein